MRSVHMHQQASSVISVASSLIITIRTMPPCQPSSYLL